jgi:hypothetical protein
VELAVAAAGEDEARAVVERLASELLSNPLIEAYAVEALGEGGTAASGATGTAAPGDAGAPAASAEVGA